MCSSRSAAAAVEAATAAGALAFAAVAMRGRNLTSMCFVVPVFFSRETAHMSLYFHFSNPTKILGIFSPEIMFPCKFNPSPNKISESIQSIVRGSSICSKIFLDLYENILFLIQCRETVFPTAD